MITLKIASMLLLVNAFASGTTTAVAPEKVQEALIAHIRKHQIRKPEKVWYEHKVNGRVIELTYIKTHSIKKLSETAYTGLADFHLYGVNEKFYQLKYFLKVQSGLIEVDSSRTKIAREWVQKKKKK